MIYTQFWLDISNYFYHSLFSHEIQDFSVIGFLVSGFPGSCRSLSTESDILYAGSYEKLFIFSPFQYFTNNVTCHLHAQEIKMNYIR